MYPVSIYATFLEAARDALGSRPPEHTDPVEPRQQDHARPDEHAVQVRKHDSGSIFGFCPQGLPFRRGGRQELVRVFGRHHCASDHSDRFEREDGRAMDLAEWRASAGRSLDGQG